MKYLKICQTQLDFQVSLENLIKKFSNLDQNLLSCKEDVLSDICVMKSEKKSFQ